jgi:hypothetical protein
MTRLDQPWHRPGAAWYALRRLPVLLHPPVSVYQPAPPAARTEVTDPVGSAMRTDPTLSRS